MHPEQVTLSNSTGVRAPASLSSAMMPTPRTASVVGLRANTLAPAESHASPVERLKLCINELDASLRARDEQDMQAAQAFEARIHELEKRLQEAQDDAASARNEVTKLQGQLQAAALTISAHEMTIEEQKGTIESSIAAIQEATARAAQSSKLAELQGRTMRILLNMPPAAHEVPRQ